MLELYLFITYNCRLTTDTRIQQNQQKLSIYLIYNLCATHPLHQLNLYFLHMFDYMYTHTHTPFPESELTKHL